MVISCQQDEYNIYMQKEKKQSELLATLSEILKLYHKYLLYSLRQDLLPDRKNGMLENIRDRIKSIIEKNPNQNRQSTPNQYNMDEPDQSNTQKYDNKLLSRFLARLSEKLKGYMDQYTKDVLPQFLSQSMAAIQKTSQHFRLADLLISLFGISNCPNPTKTKREDRKNSSLYNLMQFPEKRNVKSSTVVEVLLADKAGKAQQSRTNFLTAYTRKSNMIQQVIQLINIIEIDEKDLRRKYFAVQQVLTQNQSQSQNNLRPLHAHFDHPVPTYINFSISNTTNPFTPKDSATDSSPILTTNQNLMITNSTQYTIYQGLNNNQVYLDMMDRNRTIGHMIKKYETYYDKYRKRQMSKIEKSRQRQKDRQRMKQRLSMPTIHQFDNVDHIKIKEEESTEDNQNPSPQQNYTSPQKSVRQIIKKVSSKQIQDQIERELYRQMQNQKSSNTRIQSHSKNGDVEIPTIKTENSSFPELRTVKFEYNVEPTSLNIYNLNNKNNILSKKAQKLLKIIKPTLNPVPAPETKNQRKQKSISSSALSNLNPISSHLKGISTYTEGQINLNLQLNSRQYQPPDSNSSQSQFLLSTSTYNNLNSIVRSKQLLNKLLNKVAGSASVAEMEGSVICLSRMPEGDKKIDSFDEIGTTAYGDHNWKQNRQHNSQDNHTNSLHRGKKPLLYRQELMERRAKAEAMYNKSRPSQIGSLRSNISFPKMEQFEAPSFLMACRSYQRAADGNNKNNNMNTTNTNKNIN